MMMMIWTSVLALLAVPAAPFTTRPTFVTRSSRYSVTPLQEQTGAEAYLEQCMAEWTALEAELASFKAGPNQDNEVRTVL